MSIVGAAGASMFLKRNVARREQERVRLADALIELLQRRQIVQNPEAASVGGDHEIIEVLLNHHAVDGRMGQVLLQRLPVIAFVKGDIQRVLGAEIQQAAPNGILANDVRVTERTLGDASHDQLPTAPIVVGAIDPRIAVVLLMPVDDDVRRSCVVT